MAWSPEQISNAKSIIQVGRSLGASDRDITIALMAAWQESSMRNLSYGDRDSVGLFQQRNAWGSRADRMDPVKAARMFFLGGAQGQRGLLDFANRDSYGLGQAAQKVQVSAFPDAYNKWESEAGDMLSELGAGGGVGTQKPTIPTSGIPAGDSTPDEKELLDGAATAKPPTSSTALGIDSPTNTGIEAAGTAAAGAPGIESADKQPTLNPIPMVDENSFLPLSNGQKGGVAGTFEDLFPNKGPVGGARQRLVDIAKGAVGVPYVWGGNSLTSGVDCSGLVQQAFKEIGINLPRISAAQGRTGTRTSISNLKMGDLVFWDNSTRNSGADHVAIYLGNGQIIEAPRPGLSVRIRQLGKDEGDMWGVHIDY